MIRFDLILIFRQGAQNVWWYWHTAEEAVCWARDTFPDVKGIQVAWTVGTGLKIQQWKSEPFKYYVLGEFPLVDPAKRWSCLEIE